MRLNLCTYEGLPPDTLEFYLKAMSVLQATRIPFLVGGVTPWPITPASSGTPRTSTFSSGPRMPGVSWRGWPRPAIAPS